MTIAITGRKDVIDTTVGFFFVYQVPLCEEEIIEKDASIPLDRLDNAVHKWDEKDEEKCQMTNEWCCPLCFTRKFLTTLAFVYFIQLNVHFFVIHSIILLWKKSIFKPFEGNTNSNYLTLCILIVNYYNHITKSHSKVRWPKLFRFDLTLFVFSRLKLRANSWI